MKEKKTQAKSVRMTPTVYSIVDQCEGKGFNDKFERFVLQTKEDREGLKREVSYWHEIRAGYQKEADKINEVRNLLKASEERIEYIDACLGILCNWILSLGSDTQEQADSKSLDSGEQADSQFLNSKEQADAKSLDSREQADAKSLDSREQADAQSLDSREQADSQSLNLYEKGV